MVVGNFNYYQILFSLDTFKFDSEKLSYLEKISSELTRIVDCFETPKALPLNMYASKNIFIEDSCFELNSFIIKQFEKVTSNPYDKRYPGQAELKNLLQSETAKYKKLLQIVNNDINILVEKINKQNTLEKEVTPNSNHILPQKMTPAFISYLLINNSETIIWNKSIGELIDLIKIIIVLELHPDINENGIIDIICNRFVDFKKESFSKIQIEKTYNMLQNTFWLNSSASVPKFYH